MKSARLVLLLTACAADVPDEAEGDPVTGLWLTLGSADAEAWALALLDVLDRGDGEGGGFVPEALPADATGPTGVVLPELPLRAGLTDASGHDAEAWRRVSGLVARACVEEPSVTAWERVFAVADCWSLGTCRDAQATSTVVARDGSLVLAEQFSRLDLDGRSLWVLRSASTDAEGTWQGAASLLAWAEDPEDSGRTRWLRAAWQRREGSADDVAAALEEAAARGEDFLDQGRVACEEGA